MSDYNFEDLAVFGITEQTLAADREAIAHDMVAEDYLAHMGIEIPDDADDEFFDDADDYIAQAGVKGMRWGHRRARGKDGLVVKSGGKTTVDKSKVAKGPSKFQQALANRKASSDVKKTQAVAKPERPKARAKQMTTAELTDAINRIKLEQQYSQLTATQKPAWRKDVEEIAKTALKQNAQQYATQYLQVGVGALLKQAGVPSPQDIAAKANKKPDDK